MLVQDLRLPVPLSLYPNLRMPAAPTYLHVYMRAYALAGIIIARLNGMCACTCERTQLYTYM